MVTDSSRTEAELYDLVILGGSISGSSLALLMRRWCPDLRVLVIERLECFGRRIGEATVELSSSFLRDVLKLDDHLAREHLPKHGLRFWFADENAERLHEMSEVGPIHAPDIPSFQLDRSRLDEKVLELAAQEGVQIARPAKLVDVELDPTESRVVFEDKQGSTVPGGQSTGLDELLDRLWQTQQTHGVGDRAPVLPDLFRNLGLGQTVLRSEMLEGARLLQDREIAPLDVLHQGQCKLVPGAESLADHRRNGLQSRQPSRAPAPFAGNHHVSAGGIFAHQKGLEHAVPSD